MLNQESLTNVDFTPNHALVKDQKAYKKIGKGVG